MSNTKRNNDKLKKLGYLSKEAHSDRTIKLKEKLKNERDDSQQKYNNSIDNLTRQEITYLKASLSITS